MLAPGYRCARRFRGGSDRQRVRKSVGIVGHGRLWPDLSRRDRFDVKERRLVSFTVVVRSMNIAGRRHGQCFRAWAATRIWTASAKLAVDGAPSG